MNRQKVNLNSKGKIKVCSAKRYPFLSPRVKWTRFEDISESSQNWVKEYRDRNLAFNSPLVIMFLRYVKPLKLHLEREVYFKIGPQSYFLDFLDVDRGVAIEIDGKQHQTEEWLKHDENRDRAFGIIGIDTIRLKREDLTSTEKIKARLEQGTCNKYNFEVSRVKEEISKCSKKINAYNALIESLIKKKSIIEKKQRELSVELGQLLLPDGQNLYNNGRVKTV